MNKRLTAITLFAAVSLIAGAAVYAQQYTLYYSGGITGYVTITKDTQGKVTVIPQIIKDLALQNEITNNECPLIPQGQRISVYRFIASIVIDGNTITETGTDGKVITSIINGNTTIRTMSGGSWIKTVVEGNTTIITWLGGSWRRIVVSGNTITETVTSEIYGLNSKTVVEGNTRTTTWNEYDGPQWRTTVIEKQGYNIYIHTTASRTSFGL
jgi:hypothetical protein